MTEEKKKLEHSKGGSTTKDATDLGVPMLAGDPDAPMQGPEDALGPGPTRGDYRERVEAGRHVQTEATYKGRYDNAPEIEAIEQLPTIPDPGGPLDAADPNYERLLAQRERQAGTDERKESK